MGKTLTDKELKAMADDSRLDLHELEQRHETWAATVEYSCMVTFRRFLAFPAVTIDQDESAWIITDDVLCQMNESTRNYINRRRKRGVPILGLGHHLEESCSA